MQNTHHPFHIPFNRRRLIRSLALAGGAFFTTRGLFAEMLTLTPRTTAGPYYPDHLPLDRDNDLIRITDDITPAVGTITNVSGRVLDKDGTSIKGALVELWQADDHGTYIHSRGAEQGVRDAHFQGCGKFETETDGGWKFRTIKPGLYTGRTRHFHFGITLPGQSRRFTTQLFLQASRGMRATWCSAKSAMKRSGRRSFATAVVSRCETAPGKARGEGAAAGVFALGFASARRVVSAPCLTNGNA